MTQYALLAGISRYEDNQITDLEFAAKDVLALKDRLVRVLGFLPENIYVFTDERDKTYVNNHGVMEKFARLCRITEPGDTFFFCFAGHAVEKPDGVYLMTANTKTYSPSLFKSSSIPVHFLQEELKETRATNRIFVIDACRNDPDKARGVYSSGYRYLGFRLVSLKI